jgi:hypothetical protein
MGLDHQLWQLEAKVTFVAFNHLNEKSLILSRSWWRVLAEPRNNLWFLSVHTTQAHASQMSCKNDRRAREPPAEKVNWTKWSRREVYSTIGMPIHAYTKAQSIDYGDHIKVFFSLFWDFVTRNRISFFMNMRAKAPK